MKSSLRKTAVAAFLSVCVLASTGCTRAITDGVSIGLTDGISNGLADVISDYIASLTPQNDED